MPVPVISIAQMRDWEQATWAAGQQEAEVIRRVGRCVARRALRLTQAGDLILILAGKGHNGDDARCAREHLADRRVEVFDVTESAADLAKLDALLASRPALVVDGMFGIGLDRPLGPGWVSFIERVQCGAPAGAGGGCAVGVERRHGRTARGGDPASVTLTVGAPKTGLLRQAAWPFVGRLEVATDVGLAPCPQPSELQWTFAGGFRGLSACPRGGDAKGNYGHLAIVAGSLGYHGAAVLAARGAQRAQPGLITLHTLESVYHAVAPQLQAVMVSVWPAQGKLAGSHDSILIGPGLAAADMPDQMKMLTRNLWRDLFLPVVVDASALDWLPLDPVPRNAVRVITPHPGEAARLLRCTPQQVQANRLECPAQCLPAFRQRLGGAQGPSNAHRPKLRGSLCEPVGQSAPGPGRQRRRAGRVSGRLAGPARLAG